MKTPSLGELIRQHRAAAGMSLMQLAADVAVDTSLLSKWERGERRPARDQVVAIARSLGVKAEPLLVTWLRDKILFDLRDEHLAMDVLKAAEEQVAYERAARPAQLERKLAAILAKDPRVKTAWLFGSYARGEAHAGSDIDLLVDFAPVPAISYLDIFDLAHELEQALGCRVDIIERRALVPEALRAVEKDMIRIHG